MAQKDMFRAVVNSPSTKLTTAINSMDTTIPVADTSVFATAPGIATLYDDNYTETIKYTGIDTTNKTLTGVTRGFDGTARDWAIDKQIARLITAYDINTLEENITDCFQFANDGKTAVANAVTAKGVPASPSDTFPTLATKIGQITTGVDVSDTTAVLGDVLTGKYFYGSDGVRKQGSMVNQGSKTITPTSSIQTLSAGYYSGITINASALNGYAANGSKAAGADNYVRVTGLTFKPKIIAISVILSDASIVRAFQQDGLFAVPTMKYSNSAWTVYDTSAWTFSADGFSIYIPSGNGNTVNWWAYA